jgi:DNA invertase Pin-like site-specific DNA recombinase
MMAVFAEYEAKRISERTSEALQALKRKGVKLGSKHPEIGSEAGLKIIKQKADDYASRVEPVVNDIIRKSGANTLRDIAAALTVRGIQTPRGNVNWNPSQVSNLLKRLSGGGGYVEQDTGQKSPAGACKLVTLCGSRIIATQGD